MENATANSRTTMKKPLSSCRLPTNSSNSPVSLFLMAYGFAAPASPPVPTRSRARPKDAIISSGSGNTMVVFFSAPISTSVCRYRNWMRRRLLLDHFRGHGQLFGRRVLAFGMDDLGAPLAFGLGLARDGADHLLGQIHLLHFHHGHLHAPRRGVLVQDGLQPHVELFALAEQVRPDPLRPARCAAWSAPVATWRRGNWKPPGSARRGSITRK